MVLLMALMMVLGSASPALAAAGGGGQDGQKDPHPVTPPGRDNPNGTPSENAADPVQTGRANKFTHGSPQNGNPCEAC
jgi:hypothetical protein